MRPLRHRKHRRRGARVIHLPTIHLNRAEAETIADCNLTADNVISCMLENECNWDAIVAGILKDKASRTESTQRVIRTSGNLTAIRPTKYSFAAVPRERNTSISSLLLTLFSCIYLSFIY